MVNLFQTSINSENEEFLALRDKESLSGLKNYCIALWNQFSPFADRSFINEFALHPHQRFWEMYLGVHLLNLGFKLFPPTTDKGPDLHLVIDDSNVWIEATVPGEGEGDDKVPTIHEHSQFEPIPVEKIILRFTNSLSEKNNKLNNYLKDGIIKPGDSFLIAICGGMIQLVQMDADPIPAIVKSVYPIGNKQILLDTTKLEIIDDRYNLRTYVVKESGSTVSTKFFGNPTNPKISGVIYSETTMINQQSINNDGFLIIHNSFAENPVKKGVLKLGKECWKDGDKLFFAQKIDGI